MCLIAPATCSVSSTDGKSVLGSVWDIEMGPKGDAYTADLCRLARAFGSKPLPHWSYVSISSRSGSSRIEKDQKKSWWNATKPSSPYEEELHETQIPPPHCLKNEFFQSGDRLDHWSRYDMMKFMLGLRILERISSFFRIRTNLCVMTSNNGTRLAGDSSQNLSSSLSQSFGGKSMTSVGEATGLIAIEIEEISFSFQSVSSFYLKISDSISKRDQKGQEEEWLTDSTTLSSPFPLATTKNRRKIQQTTEIDQEIRTLVLHTAESFLCAIYDLVITSSSITEKNLWISDITACLQVAELFSPHSFIRQTSRYLENSMTSSTGNPTSEFIRRK